MTTSDCLIKIQHNGSPSAIRCKYRLWRLLKRLIQPSQTEGENSDADEGITPINPTSLPSHGGYRRVQSGDNNKGQITFPTTLKWSHFARLKLSQCLLAYYRGMALSQASKRVSPSRALVPGTSVLSLIFAPEYSAFGSGMTSRESLSAAKRRRTSSSMRNCSGPPISTMPFTGGPTAILPTPLATSSAAMG